MVMSPERKDALVLERRQKLLKKAIESPGTVYVVVDRTDRLPPWRTIRGDGSYRSSAEPERDFDSVRFCGSEQVILEYTDGVFIREHAGWESSLYKD